MGADPGPDVLPVGRGEGSGADRPTADVSGAGVDLQFGVIRVFPQPPAGSDGSTG